MIVVNITGMFHMTPIALIEQAVPMLIMNWHNQWVRVTYDVWLGPS
jgi:hypothetical protein